MSRYVVASEFGDRRGYFTGGFGAARSLGIIAPNASFDDRTRAFIMQRPEVATTLAALLSDLATASGEPRDWFVVEIAEIEIPEQPRASVANAARAADRADASPHIRPVTPSEGECFWPRCSNCKRCAAHGSCVAKAQAGGASFPAGAADA